MTNKHFVIITAILIALASQRAELSFAQPGGRPGGRPGARNAQKIEYKGATSYNADVETRDQTYASENAEELALLVTSGVAKVTNSTIVKSGDPSERNDSYDFYGVNAAALATEGGTLEINGGSITTDSSYSSGLFAYGTGIIKAREVEIKTNSHNSGGVMVTGGGTLDGVNLTIVTEGGSSAAIRSDRGGGKLMIDGGSYTTNGSGSPAIYSTADITVKNASLTSTQSEGAIIEGRNSITLENTKLVDDNTTLHGKSTTRKNIFIYQSFSGDAKIGASNFSAKDCEIVTKRGDSVYVTNTSCVVTLTGNKIVNEDSSGYFLRAQREGWGRKGANGGAVVMTLANQDVEGNIFIDNISTLTLAITQGSHYVGALNSANTAKELAVTLDAESTLELTADAYVSSFENADPTGQNVKLNGHTLHIGEEFVPDNLPETGDDKGFGPGAPPDGGRPADGEFGPPEPPQDDRVQIGSPRRPNEVRAGMGGGRARGARPARPGEGRGSRGERPRRPER